MNKTIDIKNLIRKLHYIEKWRKGANIMMPTSADISLALDDCIRFLRDYSRYDDVPLTIDILKSNGFKQVDDSICIGQEYTQYASCDGLVIISTNLSNTPGRKWYVHVDSDEFTSVGGLDVGTIGQLNKFLDLCDSKTPRLRS